MSLSNDGAFIPFDFSAVTSIFDDWEVVFLGWNTPCH